MSDNIVKLSKDSAEDARWVMLSASTDPARQILSGMKVSDDRIAAADGFTLHIAPRPAEYEPMVGKVIKPDRKIPVSPQPVEYETIDGTFPDYQQIIPTASPTVRIGLNRQFLGRLATMPSDSEMLVVDVYSETQPVKVSSLCDGLPYTAVMMPMHVKYDNGKGTIEERLGLPPVKVAEVDHDKCIDREIRMKDKIKDLTATIAQLETELAELRGQVVVVEPEPVVIPEPVTVDVPIDDDPIGAALRAAGCQVYDPIGDALRAGGFMVADDTPPIGETEPEPVAYEHGKRDAKYGYTYIPDDVDAYAQGYKDQKKSETAVERQTFGLKTAGKAEFKAKAKAESGSIKPLDISALLG